jgi:hypothetical protein
METPNPSTLAQVGHIGPHGRKLDLPTLTLWQALENSHGSFSKEMIAHVLRDAEFEVIACPEQDEPDSFLASGDDDKDAKTVAEILERANAGDVWAWCVVEVRASVDLGLVCLTGEDVLSACSYQDEEDFKRDAYYLNMLAEACKELAQKLAQLKDIAQYVA